MGKMHKVTFGIMVVSLLVGVIACDPPDGREVDAKAVKWVNSTIGNASDAASEVGSGASCVSQCMADGSGALVCSAQCGDS
jgi:hypothetical protein